MNSYSFHRHNIKKNKEYHSSNYFFVFFFFIGIFSCSHALAVVGNSLPGAIFSQEVFSYDSKGNPLPALVIKPSSFKNIQKIQYPLGEHNLLSIHTNIENTEERGLSNVAEIVHRGYHFIEKKSGLKLDTNILLYVIELDYIPSYYKFQATYPVGESQWGEVRLALVQKGSPLVGPNAPENINELLFDTLPHELGHDLLGKIPNLLHDHDGAASCHTRWFIEGICEFLAKSFSHMEAPDLWSRYISQRNIDTVLFNEVISASIFSWSQENENSFGLESDLYGASMLLMTEWIDKVQLVNILKKIIDQDTLVDGEVLLSIMRNSSGYSGPEMLKHAEHLPHRISNIFALQGESFLSHPIYHSML